jgi:type IV pilus assembly protein PilC
MATFIFHARTLEGREVDGTRQAADRQELISRLRAENLTVTRVQEEGAASSSRAGKSSSRAQSPFMQDLLYGKVKNADLMVFSRQLAAMLKAGISLTDAIHTIAHGLNNQRLRNAMLEVRGDVQRGRTLTEALRRHPAIFDHLFLSMIHAGETSGGLAQNVARLSDYLERKENFRRKLKSATAYPKFVMGFFLVMVCGIFLFLMPKFKEIFADFGAKLPPLTEFFMAVSAFMRENIGAIVLSIIFVVICLMSYKRTEAGRRQYDRVLLKLPFFGPLFLKSATARLAMTLSTLLNNGIPLTDAMRIASNTVGNRVIEEGLDGARNNVIKGQGLAESLARIPELPRLLARMVRVGEESGTLAGMLQDIAVYYDQEVDAALTRITAVIEPILICGMGVVVLITVIAIYLPIFSMSSNIQG